MTRIEWNTGRLYAEDGQRIVAEIGPDDVLFWDCARGIGGIVPLPEDTSPLGIRRHVMLEYDMNRSKPVGGDRLHSFIMSLTPKAVAL
jgi:hypothetical protein